MQDQIKLSEDQCLRILNKLSEIWEREHPGMVLAPWTKGEPSNV